MYLFEVNLNLLANTSTPDVALREEGPHCQLPLLLIQLVLRREKCPCSAMQARRCTSTIARRVRSVMIALTGGTDYLRFYQKMSG